MFSEPLRPLRFLRLNFRFRILPSLNYSITPPPHSCLRQRILANHVEQRLASFFFDDFERLGQRVRHLLRVFDSSGVGAARLRRQLEIRRRAQVRAGKIARARGHAVGIQPARCIQARVPRLVVVDDGQKRNAI